MGGDEKVGGVLMTLKEFHHYSLTPFWPLIIDLKDLNPIYPHSLAPTLKVTT